MSSQSFKFEVAFSSPESESRPIPAAARFENWNHDALIGISTHHHTQKKHLIHDTFGPKTSSRTTWDWTHVETKLGNHPQRNWRSQMEVRRMILVAFELMVSAGSTLVSLLAFLQPQKQGFRTRPGIFTCKHNKEWCIFFTHMLVNTSCCQNQKGSKYQKNAGNLRKGKQTSFGWKSFQGLRRKSRKSVESDLWKPTKILELAPWQCSLIYLRGVRISCRRMYCRRMQIQKGQYPATVNLWYTVRWWYRDMHQYSVYIYIYMVRVARSWSPPHPHGMVPPVPHSTSSNSSSTSTSTT